MLQNINKLNRSLEGVIAVRIRIFTAKSAFGLADLGSIAQVGNEFGAVEALWSQFEGVMAQETDDPDGKEEDEKRGEQEDGGAEQEDARAGQKERGR